jgi:rhamnose transport system ATP-binding protein
MTEMAPSTARWPAEPAPPSAAKGEPLLQVAGIEKSFPGVHALSGVSFEVAPGEVHALLGENGAGKSTLIKIVSGVYRPDSGSIYVDGRELRFEKPDDARRAGIATIYQELLLFPELTVAENVFMGHAPKTRFGSLDWAEMRTKTEALLASLDIHDLAATQIVGALSVGNRQRVEILRALSQDARLLIMDEPTAALTEYDVKRLFEIVRRLKSRGVGIIYISHRLDEIFGLADRVTVLRDGAHVGMRRVADTSSSELVQLMVGRHIENLFPKVAAHLGAPVLEVRDLVRRPMTKSVSLTVRAGEIVGLAGLVGSGRSELAQTVFGVTPAESGQILVGGQEVRVRSPGEARALGIAYVPEDRGTQGLVRPMSVLHNFSLASLSRLSRGGFIDRNAEETLAREGVARFSVKASSLGQIVGKLSGGNQQKIVLGKWLANNPKLLILDEPTRGIDVGAKAEIHRLMSVLAGQGLAILMISSELPEVLGMSDRVLVMREGRFVAEFARAEATPEAVGAAMMGGEGAEAGRLT